MSWAIIATFVVSMALPLAKQILVGVGVGVVTYSGMSVALDALQAHIFAEFAGLPSQMVQIMGLMHVDDALNIMFSALAARAALAGWTGGIKRQTTMEPWLKPGTSSIDFPA